MISVSYSGTQTTTTLYYVELYKYSPDHKQTKLGIQSEIFDCVEGCTAYLKRQIRRLERKGFRPTSDLERGQHASVDWLDDYGNHHSLVIHWQRLLTYETEQELEGNK